MTTTEVGMSAVAVTNLSSPPPELGTASPAEVRAAISAIEATLQRRKLTFAPLPRRKSERRAGTGENSSCPFYHRAVWGNTRLFHQPRFCFPGGRQTGPCFFRRPTAAFLLCQTIPWACPSPYPPGHSLETGSRHPGETGFSPSGG